MQTDQSINITTKEIIKNNKMTLTNKFYMSKVVLFFLFEKCWKCDVAILHIKFVALSDKWQRKQESWKFSQVLLYFHSFVT